MALKVIGAGFGRTGTTSLKLALERLGFGPCHHMTEVLQHRAAAVWADAAEGTPQDWEAVFDGYQSAVDWPSCDYWQELAAHWPDARIILTLRDPAAWYESTQATIFGLVPQMLTGDGAPMERMLLAIQRRHFGGSFTDRAHLIAGYERHNALVRTLAPPGRLLEYDVAEGWGPLCRFLGVAVPEEPFPVANTRADFAALLASAAQQGHI